MDQAALTAILRDIGRGRHSARDLPRDSAHALFAAVLAGEVSGLALGAVLMAFRLKGESLDELAGFLDAAHAVTARLEIPGAPAGTVPLVIPAYNGARRLPNLTPLLVQLVAREGVPVLVHGITRDAGRVTTCEIFEAQGVAPAADLAQAQAQLAERGFAFIAIDTLAPALARVLALRAEMGVRGSGHTIVKMLQPFGTPALRLVSVTHPEYLTRMREFFTTLDSGALLLRGAEGEAVAHPRREPAIEFAVRGSAQVWRDETAQADAPVTTPDSTPAAAQAAAAALPDERDAAVTAAWIDGALAGRNKVPRAIAHQVQCCLRASCLLRAAV